MNDLDASFNSNKEPITLDIVLAMTEESFLTTERYRFEGVQQYLEYMRATEEVEMLKVLFYFISFLNIMSISKYINNTDKTNCYVTINLYKI